MISLPTLQVNLPALRTFPYQAGRMQKPYISQGYLQGNNIFRPVVISIAGCVLIADGSIFS